MCVFEVYGELADESLKFRHIVRCMTHQYNFFSDIPTPTKPCPRAEDGRRMLSLMDYTQLNRKAACAHDNTIRAGLNSWPQYIPEWDEYAVLCLDGTPAYGATQDKCLAVKNEADEVWCRARAQTPIITEAV